MNNLADMDLILIVIVLIPTLLGVLSRRMSKVLYFWLLCLLATFPVIMFQPLWTKFISLAIPEPLASILGLIIGLVVAVIVLHLFLQLLNLMAVNIMEIKWPWWISGLLNGIMVGLFIFAVLVFIGVLPHHQLEKSRIAKSFTKIPDIEEIQKISKKSNKQNHQNGTEQYQPITAPDTLKSIAREIFLFINQQREEYGLHLLSWDENVYLAALKHSKDMAERGYFNHNTPEGVGVGIRLSDAGVVFSSYGECIFYYTPFSRNLAEEVVQGWMESPDHRAIILKDKFNYGAVGVACRFNDCYITFDAIRR